MRILVTGATGHVGPQLISQVLERGHSGRAIVRNRSTPPDLGKDVEIFAGDLTDAETPRPALVGVDGVFLLSGYDDDGLVRQMRAAGVSRAALLSSSAAPTGDIAAVATVALLADAPESRAYRFTGPEALHAGDRVAILGEVRPSPPIRTALERRRAQGDEREHAARVRGRLLRLLRRGINR
jgi:uncharacterized protein YbjT (DUF2867 family)